MFRFVKYKILNKKWLNFCLLTGVILLSAFLCVYPMFKEGSLNKLIQTSLVDYTKEKNKFSAMMETSGKLTDSYYTNTGKIVDYTDSYKDTWMSYMGIDALAEQKYLEIAPGYAEILLDSRATQVRIGMIPEIENHVNVVNGVFYDEAENCDEKRVKEALSGGAFPCVISEKFMDTGRLVVGDTLRIKNSKNNIYEYVVTGIIREKEEDNLFWYHSLSDYGNTLFVDASAFENIMGDYTVQGIYYCETLLMDYRQINAKNAENIYSYICQFSKLDSAYKTNLKDILSSYMETKKSVSVILITFELPIVALLLLFIYMISGQILEMETGEIAMLKSRGISRFKVIKLYILQSSVIALIGSVIGMPFGYLFCKLGAGTDAFLVFTLKNTEVYKPNVEMLMFSGIAFLAAMLFMTIPVIPLSKFTITERKKQKISLRTKAFWEKFFLDIPITAVAIYLLVNYMKQRESISLTVIGGGRIDPVMFLDSSVFIIGCGLFTLRIVHLIVRMIYAIGRKKWKPAEYVAFLQIIRSSKRQGFISVFLVMTIAMGIFNANLARSVNDNMEERTKYNIGCDYIINERWQLITKKGSENKTVWKYTEPDFRRYDFLKNEGVESMTRVISDQQTDISVGTVTENKCQLFGIDTKEFGETAELKSGLNDKHWFNYLNDLGANPTGVLISSNLAEKYGIQIGDSVKYSRYSPIDSKDNYASEKAQVVGIVDAFPGYESVVYTEAENGEVSKRDNYLIVANYNTVMNTFRERPYEIWMKMSDKTDTSHIEELIAEKGFDIISSESLSELIKIQRDSTMIQITNGMFSVGFVISLTVCAVGFLIYWILTIKERELIYGIYRSMGLSMREIIRMLTTEQIFSSLAACVGGYGVGMLTTFLFTKLISVVYLPRMHNLPIQIIVNPGDSVKMCVIVGGVLVICFIIICRLIGKMNITKALKLGDD